MEKKNKRYEGINDYIDDMSDATMIVVINMVSDISQAPSLSKLHFFISFRRSHLMLLLSFRAHLSWCTQKQFNIKVHNSTCGHTGVVVPLNPVRASNSVVGLHVVSIRILTYL